METLDPRSIGPEALIPLLDSNNPLTYPVRTLARKHIRTR